MASLASAIMFMDNIPPRHLPGFRLDQVGYWMCNHYTSIGTIVGCRNDGCFVMLEIVCLLRTSSFLSHRLGKSHPNIDVAPLVPRL